MSNSISLDDDDDDDDDAKYKYINEYPEDIPKFR